MPTVLLVMSLGIAAPPSILSVGPDGRLVYAADAKGNRVPDFSHAGYGGGAATPAVVACRGVPPVVGDNGPRIQHAIDEVAALPAGRDGVRGAVQLDAGRYEVRGQIKLAGGVVLCGRGRETVLVATGVDRRALIAVRGSSARTFENPVAVADEYVPVNATALHVESAAGFAAGDRVVVEHPATKEWIAALGMDRFPTRDKGSYLDWRPGTLGVTWDRTVTAVAGNRVTLDAPLTAALDAKLTRSVVRKVTSSGRVRAVGIEGLRCESESEAGRPLDEDHAWTGIVIEHAEDVWVRQVSFRHFAGSAVAVWETARRVTVADCDSAAPVSELAGYRRHTFLTAGQQTLFLRCKAANGRHDFAVGHLAAGPNAFVQCDAVAANRGSGPIGSWATGVLYDNVTVDGAGLALTNRETDDQGTGWAAANSVLWQCVAPTVTCRMPPTAQNWAFGVWGHFTGDGHWRQLNEFVTPQSLYAAQLQDRLGAAAKAVLEPAARSTGQAVAIPTLTKKPAATASRPVALRNGWLTVGDKLLTGGRTGTVWWRGHTLPARAAELGVGLTRFVPGRDGPGFTDDLDQLAAELRTNNVARLDHHWGLWYDRRRDDHQMVRRIDGDAWPPFYEQPWARSGRGTASDGLSKYDLARFNPWYFARLAAFADAAEREGLLLVQQMYFQHNVLEAGAHWADFPWRPANCVQATGFPEPPPYENNKRITLAAEFYDVAHPVRRDLHRAYIRHCLDVLGRKSNVLFQTGEEFTGPRAFVEFWLDTIAEWQRETGRAVRVGLSCTKGVQDAILADPVRAKLVGVIDLKYWWHTADGQTYDPKSGDLSPRQQLRAWKGNKSRSAESVARAVAEYRTKFPDKAVIVSHDGETEWAALAAGASIPALPATADPSILAAVPRMKPTAGRLLLTATGEHYLAYSAGGAVELDLPPGRFAAAWVDRMTGRLGARTSVAGKTSLTPPNGAAGIVWVAKQP